MKSVERLLAGNGRDPLVGPFKEDVFAGVLVHESFAGPVLYGLSLDWWREFSSVLKGDDVLQQDFGVSAIPWHVVSLGVPVGAVGYDIWGNGGRKERYLALRFGSQR